VWYTWKYFLESPFSSCIYAFTVCVSWKMAIFMWTCAICVICVINDITFPLQCQRERELEAEQKILDISRTFLHSRELPPTHFFTKTVKCLTVTSSCPIRQKSNLLLNSYLPWPTSLLYSAIVRVLLRDELDKRSSGKLALFKYHKTLPGSHIPIINITYLLWANAIWQVHWLLITVLFPHKSGSVLAGKLTPGNLLDRWRW